MEDNFEKQLLEVFNEESEMPKIVRVALDDTYNRIRVKSKKKNKIALKIAAAVCCIIISGTLLSNKSVMASIKTFFNFNDKGVEQAVNNGYVNENSVSVLDNGVKVTLESYFADSNKMGLAFKLKFDDSKMLKDKVDRISMDYRIKNGNGEYIEEYIPDTKTLKGNKKYISSISCKNSEPDTKNNEVQYDIVLESNSGSIPKLENAVVEVEDVKVFYKGNERFKNIDGTWNFKLGEIKSKADNSVQYKAENNTSKIQIVASKAEPTSFNITFSVEGKGEDMDTFMGDNMKLIDEKGKEYIASGFTIEPQNDKTVVSANFPMSSYDNIGKFKLVIKSVGEVEFAK